MTEYVIDATDGFLGDEFNARAFFGPRLREEVVRCKDCKHWIKDPKPIDPGWPMMCLDSGRDMVDPDGFCAWAERRNG